MGKGRQTEMMVCSNFEGTTCPDRTGGDCENCPFWQDDDDQKDECPLCGRTDTHEHTFE